MSGLYQTITQYGDFIRLGFNFDSKTYIKWTEENFDYVKYNPRKPIARYGLSLTSLDGGLSGIPDLDSLHEYNQENKTNSENAIKGALLGAIIGNIISDGDNTATTGGALMGALAGGNVDPVEGVKKKKCTYQKKKEKIYSHSIIRFWASGKKYELDFYR